MPFGVETMGSFVATARCDVADSSSVYHSVRCTGWSVQRATQEKEALEERAQRSICEISRQYMDIEMRWGCQEYGRQRSLLKLVGSNQNF